MTMDALDAPPVPRHREAEQRALDAAKVCCEKWGVSRVTVDDIAAEAGLSRATLYRIFPGGKDVLFEALRVRELNEFLDELSARISDLSAIDDLLVGAVSFATRALRDDPHLALMMAAEPGEVLANFTVDGLPRILRQVSEHLLPFVQPHLGHDDAVAVLEVVTRLVISCFLSPSQLVDFGDEASARAFLTTLLPQVFARDTTDRTHPGGVDQ
jgi:AcrR family transcriptional regulator